MKQKIQLILSLGSGTIDIDGTYQYGRFFRWRNMEPDKEAKKLRKKAAKPTMREQAEKTGALTGKVSRKRRFFRAIGKPFRPIGRLLVRIERWKPVHFVGLIIVPRYFRNSWKELRLVVWPNRRESWRLTSAVLIFAVIFGVMIAIVDYGLDKLFKKIVLKQ